MQETATKTPQNAPLVNAAEAKRRGLLTEGMLARIGLTPEAAPIAYIKNESGTLIPLFDPNRVKAAPAVPAAPVKKERPALPPRGEDGDLPRISARRAETLGLFSKEALTRAYYEPTEGPVAYYLRKNGTRVELFEKTTCRRLPMPCIRCGEGVRYRAKLCRTCYEKELAEKRRVGDARRAAYYGKNPHEVLFFDLELTGVYDHDEVLSITVINGLGETVMDTLVRPVKKRRWNRTEKIHGITPEMVKDAPTMADLTPRLVDIFAGAKHLIAFGTSTDYSHLRRIYKTRTEQGRLRAKLIDCAAEFSSYIHEHEIELVHRSLSDAMAHFSLAWEGEAHTSAADTQACRLVFHTLFPHFYESEAI